MFKDNLKQWRKARGLTQTQLAQRLHVVRQTVSKWEKGWSVPDAQLLQELAQQLDVPVTALLAETDASNAGLGPAEDAAQALAQKLVLLESRLAQSAEKRRKRWRVFSIAGLVLAALGGVALMIPVLYEHLALIPSESASLAVIGGADGPTSIWVAQPGVGLPAVLLLLVLAVSAYGVWTTRK